MSEQSHDAEAPKIIVDSDWKSEAQAEKERLAQTEAQQQAAQQSSADAKPLSPFEELLRLLITQAMLYMGAFPDPQTGKAMVSLEAAKLYIDMISWLEEHTKLDPEQTELLAKTANELRMDFVEVTKAVAQAIKEGKISAADVGSAPPAPAGPEISLG
jgi:Domain of unknown function (DUF1844)